MFNYNVKLALRSMRRNPMMTALMVAAIAVGIGISMTTLTVYYLMNGNPIPEKSKELFAVTLDNWDPIRPFSERHPERAPFQVTFGDAERLIAISHAKRQTAMFESSMVIEPLNAQDLPFEATARVTGGAFFSMFNVPFIYGGGWDSSADTAAEPNVVLTRQLNERLFGGENSVGEWLTMQGTRFQVVGVIDTWEPTPRFYDPIEGGFQVVHDMFIPFSLTRPLELVSIGSDWGWKSPTNRSFEGFLNSESVWIQYFIELDSAGDREEYVDHLNAYVEEQKKLGRFERPMNNHIYDVMEWMEYHEVVANDSRVLLGLSFLFLVVCVLSTITLLLTKFVGKRSESSLRRALGASRKVIFNQQIVEVAMIGLSGGMIGLLLTGLGLQGIQYLYDSAPGLVRLDWVMVLSAFAIAISSSMIAGLYPAWRVCQIAPATQLKAQ
ncbi:MAG: ABC transporter permease [Gammaproteobacteria bacterium]|nr:MAG: ABC transporter permease [Gammaproteobacteria bacterium]